MDNAFRALADPTRRQILALLRNDELPAGEIASQFPMAWASVSHHLGVLKDAGLILARRDGQHIRYSLNTTVFQDTLQHLLELLPAPRQENSDA
ncbi:MAG: autorepressor SdpR family transcription factor [Gemmatimonadota bacterium]